MKYTDGSSGMSLSSPISIDADEPDDSPATVPTTPITRPCAKNTRRMDRAGIPIARRMPISLVLSVTTMISVLMMLNAATSTISSRMTDMPELLELERVEQRAVLLVPVDDAIRHARDCPASRCPMSGAVLARRRLHLETRDALDRAARAAAPTSSETKT